MNTFRWGMCVFCLIILATAASWADNTLLLHEKGKCGPDPQTLTREFTINITEPGSRVGVYLKKKPNSGKATLKVTDSTGNLLIDDSSPADSAGYGNILDPIVNVGALHISVSLQDSVGEWEIIVANMSRNNRPLMTMATGVLILLMGFLFLVVWRIQTGVEWRWFWAGVGIYFACPFYRVIPWFHSLERTMLDWMEKSLPSNVYPLAGAAYVGIISGLFSIGVTFVIAVKWSRMTREGNRAGFVAVGAASTAAILAGISDLITGISCMVLPLTALMFLTNGNEITPLPLLIVPIANISGILCAIAVRVLVLYAVATRRWRYLCYGLLILSVFDSITMIPYFGENRNNINEWWIVLLLVPFAILSIPVIHWCLTHWPSPPNPEIPAEEVLLETNGLEQNTE